MKNKKSIYILLPIVLFIWGAVVYQFFSFSSDKIPDDQNQNTAIKPFVIKPQDTSTIKVNSRDPFLGKMTSSEPKSTVPSVKKINKEPVVKEELIWPNVAYKGIVSDIKDKVKVYMVIINGKTFLMKKGDVEEGVKLKDGDRETVYLLFQRDLKVVFIQ